MATGFFKHIPNIVYDFKSDGKYYRAKDLFRKVGVWSYLQEDISGYEYHRINEGERPDVVASRLYGDGTLYWTFFLVNENLQDLSDWPKSNILFNKLGEKVSQSSDIYGFVTDVNPTFNRITLNSVSGTFTNGGIVTGSDSEKSFTISSVVNESDVVNHYTDSDNLKTTVAGSNTPVSNIEHERVLNDEKHVIRYIQPRYIDRVISEFKSLIRD